MSTDQNPETCLFRRRSSNTTLMNKKSPIQRLNLAKGLMMLGDFLPGSPLTKLTMLLHVYKGNQKYQSKNSSSTQSQEKIMIIINNGRKKKKKEEKVTDQSHRIEEMQRCPKGTPLEESLYGSMVSFSSPFTRFIGHDPWSYDLSIFSFSPN